MDVCHVYADISAFKMKPTVGLVGWRGMVGSVLLGMPFVPNHSDMRCVVIGARN